MYLKSIRAFGFKSFADKLNIEIKDGLTAIVGPNGSGKSNIVDAVRWVLGEQSSKSLRASEAKDIIFSGSKTREAHTRAYVSLILDNTDHKLNSDFKEIEVKRVIYATGENEYYLNNTKVRLKDITDLFLDTGIGADSFNIISQGSVADIISSKPENRRAIFEDAAGVLKYKKRKEISLKKLEKTQDNLKSIQLVIDELSLNVEPLKKQSEIAKNYLNYKDELKKYEIALLAQDIKDLNIEEQQLKGEITTIEQKIGTINTQNTQANVQNEKLKIQELKLDEEIASKNKEFLKLTEDLANLEAEKLITIERQKYENNLDFNNILVNLKEEELNYQKELSLEETALEELNKTLKQKVEAKDKIDEELIKQNLENNQLVNQINTCQKDILTLENNIEIINNNILNNSKVPLPVKSILNNNRLKGVHNTISSLIEVDDAYLTAIDVALGAASNFIVVDNQNVSKECINYLKTNNLGRATFFPLNIIKERFILDSDLTILKNHKGFINPASSLVKNASIYDNIIKNQLGNVLVVKDIDALNEIGSLIKYKYKIVTLDGALQNAGGSITGGSLNYPNTIAKDKLTLNKMQEELINNKTKLTNLNNILNQKRTEYQNNANNSTLLAKEIINLRELKNTKENNLKRIETTLKQKQNEIKGNEDLQNNKLDQKLVNILEEITKISQNKDILASTLNKLNQDKSDLTLEITKNNNIYKETNTKYQNIQKELNNKNITLGKLDVKLDNLLLDLSQNYNLTYEYALANYELELPIDIAREKVESLKKAINKLGEVNTGAISEYERVSERYNFLIKQSQDLEAASLELKDIINDMDKIMIAKFKTTFEAIKIEFDKVFKKLFKGGRGTLKLTDPNDLLNTGIEIEAEPPGKKLNSIALLSGGEKTLTAIATLFAIFNVKPAPFCILDEIEAALDDANVETFCKYLEEKKKQSQFILITHKKRTMEYADILYGITMQESGVSKIVSVNLENI